MSSAESSSVSLTRVVFSVEFNANRVAIVDFGASGSSAFRTYRKLT